MANTVVPRIQGDNYQALIFWFAACKLFKHASKVIKVGFDVSDMKVFDDVTIHYSEPFRDGRHDLIDGRFQQVKFHTNFAGAWGYESLIDPAFINASENSLLKRLSDAVKGSRSRQYKRNFMVLTPWGINHEDPLAKLIDGMDGKVRLEALFDGTGKRSASGQVRECWKRHLQIDSDDELAEVLRPLLIENSQTMRQALELLNIFLESVGLLPVPEGSMTNPYISLIRKLREKGFAEFNKEQLESFCGEAGLVQTKVIVTKDVRKVGIRSFVCWTHDLDEEVDRLLTVAQYFDGRSIKQHLHWQQAVVPEVKEFLASIPKDSSGIELHLDTHLSVAFLAGYLITSKSRFPVYPVQHSITGGSVWRPGSSAEQLAGEVSKCEIVSENSEGSAVLAISISHDILNDVRRFAAENLPKTKSILHFSVLPEPSTTSVAGFNHALILAQRLATAIADYRNRENHFSVIHVFMSAPAGFAFLFGQHALGLGQIQLYEYAFESIGPCRYQPSLLLPDMIVREKIDHPKGEEKYET